MEEPDDKRPTVVDEQPGLDDEPGALIGADVGGYIIERELGRGGMGVVYAATHPVIGKRAAIKVIRHSLSKSPATVERFVQEARSVNQIGHPNIVDIFAFGALSDGRSYLVMDLLDGESLRKRVKRSGLPLGEALLLVDEIASALAAAHDKGFIHRDLKPDNVYLVANPTRFEVKLLDFGLAKLLPTASIDRVFRTATGAQIGTPDYMSPEQLRGTGVDHRTDIYALGIMAFEVIARSRPRRYSDGTFDLDGLTFREALLAVPGVPNELADLIESMVAPDPRERPTLADVRAAARRIRPALAAAPALSTVRAVASELSMGAFSPSQLGARPMLPTPVAGTPTVSDPPQATSLVPAAPSASAPAMPATYGGLRPAVQAGASSPHLSTKLGVPPPPVRRSPPQPTAPAPRESRRWLALGLVLVLGAAITLAVVLAR